MPPYTGPVLRRRIRIVRVPQTRSPYPYTVLRGAVCARIHTAVYGDVTDTAKHPTPTAVSYYNMTVSKQSIWASRLACYTFAMGILYEEELAEPTALFDNLPQNLPQHPSNSTLPSEIDQDVVNSPRMMADKSRQAPALRSRKPLKTTTVLN
ncbi:hypothetical protein M422DRAFT_240007 [Sphaerobolus stellatus SS14]|uniref:Uncharacterized protein n=1 Tax=Sphaerobolus stellatus (strain SS14) TaxID=990650 RepID=A0A0C9UKD9_SPHS4|nr:hypothetical protein M422DRAFT_253109 [Sphaerobolus stellatus SS14]KIJ55391.1 hypothetical protein M422DRAFT_240007 [Sphaerobolus stellatus SS14]